MRNLDETDVAILRELQRDARRPNKALADAVGVSPSTMLHRVRSLEQRGVVRGYHAEIDPQALGRRVEALVAVKLRSKTPRAVQEFIDAVWGLDETIAITKVTGDDDVVVHVSAPDISALAETVLAAIASAPHVSDERTSIIFDHRRKQVLEPLPGGTDRR
jgi:DNA-binding Lrp family transcriptional regulator